MSLKEISLLFLLRRVSWKKIIHSFDNLKYFLFLNNYSFRFGLVDQFEVIVDTETSDQHKEY